MDRNLGGALNVWDHVFGTYQNATEERLIYGITHAPKSNNPFKVLFWEYSFLGRDLWNAPTWKDKVVVLFGRPGETFETPVKGVAQGMTPKSTERAGRTPWRPDRA